ncbi:hypothetical protein OS493_020254 [Desmophyllum pertusum]|uniref:Uncharacterized protein n=1 Tax=Desmophyllum pertusum TaxID=174260 RepID=A0A9X0D3T4_9CNID|nr:hypothetical protein OS493_020254 [Desmophyllum pertusum]
MRRLLLACAGVGLAIAGGYVMYQAWRSYFQSEENDQGGDDTDDTAGDGQAGDVTDNGGDGVNDNSKETEVSEGDGGTGDVIDNCGDVNDSCTSDGNDNSKECDGKDTEVAELDAKDNQTSCLQKSSSLRRRILEALKSGFSL